MNRLSNGLKIDTYDKNSKALKFCNEFLMGHRPRFVFGTNEWAASIANVIQVDGFIDDFTSQSTFLGKPIIAAKKLPEDTMVVSAVVGRPHTARMRMLDEGYEELDYYSFQKYSGLKLKEVFFLEKFSDDFYAHRSRYEWIYSLFADEESRKIFECLINFRLSRDISYMKGFCDIQDRQYFENFLRLRADSEVFLDVGSFDGKTSLEFIRRYPNYCKIHVFEPDPKNMEVARATLCNHKSIVFHGVGCADSKKTLKFKLAGSTSRASDDGEISIEVDKIDNLVKDRVTFLKIDIEGGELAALEGARESISRNHPALAVCVYHREDDLWRVPELVLGVRNDYKIYLRHYTECITETVMFFVPK